MIWPQTMAYVHIQSQSLGIYSSISKFQYTQWARNLLTKWVSSILTAHHGLSALFSLYNMYLYKKWQNFRFLRLPLMEVDRANFLTWLCSSHSQTRVEQNLAQVKIESRASQLSISHFKKLFIAYETWVEQLIFLIQS